MARFEVGNRSTSIRLATSTNRRVDRTDDGKIEGDVCVCVCVYREREEEEEEGET